MTVNLGSVLAEHHKNVGFVEGPNNSNPWGPEQGVGNNQAYCDSAASMVPFHSGYRWWPESQFGEKGCAYTVSHVRVGQAHGEVRFDSASDPCDIQAGDLVFYDWSGGKGSASIVDHVETAVEDAAPGPSRFHVVGYNTGTPNGCHDLWRDRKYLVCRLRPLRNGGYARSTTPPSQEDDMTDEEHQRLVNAERDSGLARGSAAAAADGVHSLQIDVAAIKAALSAGAGGAPIDIDAIAKKTADELAARLKS